MNRVFNASAFSTVPDGTEVSAFLNAEDAAEQSIPWGLLGEMSIASGRLQAGIVSAIHVHPVVTQVTIVLAGRLTLRMKDQHRGPAPYVLRLVAGQAAVTEPGVFVQLENESQEPVEVLYVASPAFVFHVDEDGLAYNDAIMLAPTWEALEREGDVLPAAVTSAYEANALRLEARRRLAARRGQPPISLTSEDIRPLAPTADYDAPCGAAIHLLAAGEHGGLAQCVVPAGQVTRAGRHRTVEELWFVLEGSGEIWRAHAGEERVDRIKAGDSLRIPVDVLFQFRADARGALKVLMATMPPWAGSPESVPIEGRWPPTL